MTPTPARATAAAGGPTPAGRWLQSPLDAAMVRHAMLRWQMAHDVMVVVHGPDDPDDVAWTRYMAELARQDDPPAAIVMSTDGGGPTPLQRRQLRAQLERWPRRPPIAVLSESRVVRGIITALQWMMPTLRASIRTFGPRELDDALDWLRVNEPRRTRAKQTLAELSGPASAADRPAAAR